MIWLPRVAVSGMAQRPFRKRLDHRRQHDAAIGAAERELRGALRMRHQADDIALAIADAGNAVERSVRIPFRANLTCGAGVVVNVALMFPAGIVTFGGVIT